ncbi:DUF1501 domain-containing protein [Alphaproteobacteria bacterium LSUCC0684]
MTISRRHFISGIGSLTLLGSPLFNARAASMKKKNFVVIMLRGGMDGLTAIQPNDSKMAQVRPDILVKGVKKLTADFNIHPRLKAFYECWQEGKASVVHATSIPYTMRSHFDGQNLMQSGGHTPYTEKTGWLGRGIEVSALGGLAISLPMPLLLRGKNTLDNFFPTWMSLPNDGDLRVIESSYSKGSALAEVMNRVRSRPVSMMKRGGDNQAHELAVVAAQELRREDGPRVAVFDIGGFDTHAAQGGEDGAHGECLADFDKVLNALRNGLGNQFDQTLIVTLTEFGRKVEQNGGYGTEHGYGTAILMAGGLVKSSQIYADWPGLATKNLFERQDLNATIDARSVYCSAMSTCFDVDFKTMKDRAFFGDPLTDLSDRLFKI